MKIAYGQSVALFWEVSGSSAINFHQTSFEKQPTGKRVRCY